MKAERRAWWLRGMALVALAVVFTAYLNPHLVVDLSNQLWACF